jgi:hypothetical protein
MLPFYYRSAKQDYRGLTAYLTAQIREGDRVVMGNPIYIHVVLHHLGIYPDGRHYVIPARKVGPDELEYAVEVRHKGVSFTVLYSRAHWFKYFQDAGRLWIVSDKRNAKMLRDEFSCVFKGYFDGSFVNLERFPIDASLYLFLWDPKGTREKGLDLPLD